MMLDTADNKIFFPRFYDIDTILSYDNSGDIKFDVDIEMEQGYWNTSSSRLWTRLRDLFHDDIVAIYNNMRQNGVSYENIMSYMYDEQIAKIPQKYYNLDYDVKYAPFEDSYIGMAHGNGYEHMKRWLKNRFIFCDTLFDYAPSYNNDVLTIRANTTELMNIEIETYTPVYQHVSWYNGQMDKKKIDGKVSTAFSGTAMAATDQEVLIYGGSNVKRIKGISSMNPNQMLIGSATKLIELDAEGCPLLADINSNKANLSPHTYLNKVNLKDCPLLGGNLRLNSSPLIQELDIRGTGITGLMLPSSIRNLQVLKLPNGITELTLNDANMLHTLEFDEGIALNSINMLNCNNLTNVVNFDLLQTPSITLDNSYNNVSELYFRDTTNLTVRNMKSLERVIYTPNNEYETFEMINVANAPNYSITTFNCPKLSTFMTTAPYRESYNNCGMTEKEIKIIQDIELLSNFNANNEPFIHEITCVFTESKGIEIEVDVSNCSNNGYENMLSIGHNIDTWTGVNCYHLPYNTGTKILQCFNSKTNASANITITSSIISIKLNKNGLFINGTKYYDNMFEDGETISIGSVEGSIRSTATYNFIRYYGYVKQMAQVKDYGDVQPNTTFTANNLDISNTQFTDIKLLCTTDVNTLKLPTTVKNFYCDSTFDLDTDWLEDGEYDVVHNELIEEYTTDYEDEVNLQRLTNIELYTNQTLSNTSILTDGRSFNASTGVEVSSGEWAMTDFIEIPPKGSIVGYLSNGTTTVSYRIAFYNNEKVFIKGAEYGANVPIVETEIPNGACFTKVAFRKYVITDFSVGIPELYIPNIIPSSSDGSIIMSMYAPNKTVQPSNGVWDLYGLEFDNFHTYGMNNDVKVSEDSFIEVADVTNMKVFRGGSDRNKQYGNIYYDSGQSNGRCITNILLKAGNHKIEVYTKDGTIIAPTVYWSNTLDGVQNNIWYNAHLGQNLTTDIYITIGFNGVTNEPWFDIDGVRYYLDNMEYMDTHILLGGTDTYNPSGTIMASDYGSILHTHGEIPTSKKINEVKSITMPSRYDDYNVTIKNANISPKEYNTMLYPLLVNEDNPIEGKLDYTNYEGDYLSWSFAYVNMNKVNIVQPKDELLNTYEYRYNTFYETEYEFDDPNEVLRYITSSSNLLPTFNEGFTYTYDKLDNNDGTYIYRIYANDPTLLTSFELEEVPYLRITNAENLLSPIDLTKYETVSISESYYDVTELYFREATNLTLTNMPYLERVIYLPNDEYEVFEIINVVNSKDYIITTSECPRLTTFMTTAPHRQSYNNEDVIAEVITEFTNTDNELFTNEYVFSKTYWEEDGTEVQGSVNLLHYEIPSIEDSVKAIHMVQGLDSTNRVTFFNDDKFISCEVITTACELDFKLHRDCNRIVFICEREGIVSSVVESILTTTLVKEYGSVEPNIIFNANTLDISNTQFTDVKLLCTTDLNILKLPTTVKNFYCDSSFDLDTDYLTDGDYNYIHNDLVEQYTTNHEDKIIKDIVLNDATLSLSDLTWEIGYNIDGNNNLVTQAQSQSCNEYIEVVGGSEFVTNGELYGYVQYDKDKNIIQRGNYTSKGTYTLLKDTSYVRFIVYQATRDTFGITYKVEKNVMPNLIPSSSDGSLIFSMYAPSKTVQPASNTWDLYGLEFDNFHTFGMNNDVKGELEVKELRNNTTIYRMLGERYTGTSLYDISYGILTATPGSYSAGCSISPILLDEDITSITITTSNGCGMFHYYSNDFNGTTATIQAFNGGTTDSGYPRNVASNTRLRLITFFNNTDLEWFDMTLVGNETKTIRYYMEDMIIVDVTDETDERRKTWNTVSYDTIYETTSLSMPSRYNNYNVTIKNANISPKEYNTMLYPLLVNEDNPIEGKLDYTNYEGDYLSWSFAYVNMNKVNIVQPKDELLNTYEYRYNAFYKTEYEFDNPNEVMEYTTTSSDLLPIFNEGFTYAYDKIDNDDGTYTYKIYANDISLLTSFELEKVPYLRITNAENLVSPIDLTEYEVIEIDNSYNSVSELYFKDATDLTLNNIPNLERVIYVPNSEYDTFELINITNASNYNIVTSNCPKLTTFMTTAPYRESYSLNAGYFGVGYPDKYTILEYIETDGTQYFNTEIAMKTGDVIVMDVDMDKRTNIQYDYWIGGSSTVALQFSASQSTILSIRGCTMPLPSDFTIRNTYTITYTLDDPNLMIFCGHYQNTFEEGQKGAGKLYSFKIYRNNKLTYDYQPRLDKDGVACLYDLVNKKYLYADGTLIAGTVIEEVLGEPKEIWNKEHGSIQPNTTFTANNLDISNTQFTDIKLLCTTDLNVLKLPTTVKNFYCDSSFDLDTDYLTDGDYNVIHNDLVKEYTTNYEDEIYIGDTVNYSYEDYNFNANDTLDYIIDPQPIPTRAYYYKQWTSNNGSYWQGCYFYDSDMNQIGYTSRYCSNFEMDIPENAKYYHLYIRYEPQYHMGEFLVNKIPSLIPSSSDGSIIMSMYAPNKTVQPASNTWDLYGLEFDNFHTFGMNNDVKGEYNIDTYTFVSNSRDNKTNIYTSNIVYEIETTTSNVSDSQPLVIAIIRNGLYQYVNLGLTRIATFSEDGKWNNIKLKDLKDGEILGKLSIQIFENILTVNNGNNLIYRVNLDELTYVYANTSEYTKGSHFESFYPSSVIARSLTPTSLIMPSRYDNYDITIKNANIKPKEYNTMLYPLLVNEDNPIEGTLDYTDYNGEYLSWSFAYTDLNKVNITQPKDELINTYKYKYNAYYDTELDNPFEVAVYTCNASGVLPTFNSEFTYTHAEMDNGDGTYTTKISADNLDNLPTMYDFGGKSQLLSVSKLNTSNLTGMYNMFMNCTSLTEINSSDWDTSKVTTMSGAFQGCDKLTSLDVSNWDTSQVTGMTQMFRGCSNLTSLDMSNWDVSKVTQMNSMFFGCGLSSLDLRNWNVEKVTTMYGIFSFMPNVTNININGWNTANLVSATEMFHGSEKLTSVDVTGLKFATNSNIDRIFYTCHELTEIIGLETWDVSNLTSMNAAFKMNNTNKLTSLNLTDWDTSNVVYFSNMFQGCSSLTEIKGIENFNTENVTEMGNMFYGCKQLTSVDTTNWNTSKVTNMSAMFYGCYSLTEVIGIEDWDCSKVQHLGSMFQGATAFGGDLDLTNWKIGHNGTLADIYSFMNGCDALKSIDLSGWIVTDGMNMAHVFATSINTIETVRLVGWSAITIQNICGAFGQSKGGTIYGSVIIDESYLRNNWVYDNVLEVAVYTCNISGKLPSFNNEFTYTHAEVDNGDGTYTTKVVADSLENLPTSISFYTNSNLIGVDKLNMSEVTSMQGMFYQCQNVEYINTSNWDISKVTNMNNVFNLCKKLTELDVSKWDVSQVINMNSLFSGCEGLTSLDLRKWDTSKLTTMQGTFNNCYSLVEIKGIEDLNTSNVTTLYWTFAGCRSLTSVNLSKWDVRKVKNIQTLFAGCRSLTSVDLTGWETESVDITYYMFSECFELTEIKGIENLNTSKVANMGYMFSNCQKLTSLDLSNWDVGKVTNMESVFNNCQKLTSLDLSNWDIGKVTGMKSMFYNCFEVSELKLGNWNSSLVNDMSYMFYQCYELQTLNYSNFDTSSVTNMECMFQACRVIEEIDVSNWNVSNVTNMNSMFKNCRTLSRLDISNWDIGKVGSVTNMANMFEGCSNLIELDTTECNMSNVQTMQSMFVDCSKLTKIIGIENWDVSNLTIVSHMFKNCSSLTTLDLSEWRPKGASLNYTFEGCTSLTNLSLAGWDNFGVGLGVFANCTSLKVLDLTGWTLELVQQGIASNLPAVTPTSTLRGSVIIDESLLPSGWVYDNALEIAVYTCSASGILPIFNKEFTTYSHSEVDNGDGTYTTKIATDSLDNLPTGISFNGISDNTYITTLLRVDKLNTSQMTNMESMFRDCRAMTYINIRSFDTSKVTKMDAMFRACIKLETIDGIEDLNTSQVTGMSSMFQECKIITSLDLHKWDVSKVKNADTMFRDFTSLTSLNIEGWEFHSFNNQYGLAQMFHSCSALAEIKGIENLLPSDGVFKRLDEMFYGCKALTELDLSNWNVSDTTNMGSMFHSCNALHTLILPNTVPTNPFSMQRMFQSCNVLTDITWAKAIKPSNLGYAFYGCDLLTSLDLSKWDVSNVTNIANMLEGCSNLTEFNTDGWDTSQVTSMSATFNNCRALTSLDLSHWNTSKVTSIQSMFRDCRMLTSLNVDGWDVSKVTNTMNMFQSCNSLEEVDLSSWNCLTNNITNMFTGCASLRRVDLSSWGMPLITMYYTFQGCTSLTSVNLNNVIGDLYNIDALFNQCSNLKTVYANNCTTTNLEKLIAKLPVVTPTSTIQGSVLIDESLLPNGWVYDNALEVAVYTCNTSGILPTFNSNFTYTHNETSNEDGTYTTKVVADSIDNLPSKITFLNIKTLLQVDKLNTSNILNAGGMFSGCSNLTAINTMLNTDKMVDMRNMFMNCTSLTSLDVSNWNTDLVENMLAIFQNCSKLTSLDVSNWNTKNVTTMNNTFYSCTSLTSLDVSNFDTSKVTNMGNMFNGCKNLTTLDVSNFDTSKVTNMASMFKNCSSLTTLDVSNFDTSKVTDMSEIFNGCNVLSIEGLGNWDTKNVVNMGGMFTHCRGITSLLEISNWDTSSSKGLYQTFFGCTELVELDVSNWNASKFETLNCVFYECKKITSFNLGNWDCRRVENMESAFCGCSSLSSVVLPKEVKEGCETKHMFRICTNLEEVIMPKGIGSIDSTFSSCHSLEKVVIPLDNITDNQANTFYNCKALVDIDWVGDLSNNFNIISNPGEHVTTESDIHELMTNLGDLKKDKIKISLSKGTIKVNDTEKTIE